MVTETIPVAEQEKKTLPALDVREVGERIGVPIVIRPWWGSRRQLYVHRHRKCGQELHRTWCCHCYDWVRHEEIDFVRIEQGRWVCPAGGQLEIKWPAVEGDKVVMWEGRCGARYNATGRTKYGTDIHLHRQTLEVLDFSAVALLIRVSVSTHRLNFLIGRDDGRPFVHVVTKNQTTVSSAYDYIVPVPVFNAQMHGFDVKRQGDVFFVPKEFFTPRPVEDESLRVVVWRTRGNHRPYNCSDVVFSNAPIDRTRHIAERLIWGYPYSLVKGIVTAPDHPPVKLDTWHYAVRNVRPCAYNPDNAGADD